jgi:excisionase family DNA binding protein
MADEKREWLTVPMLGRELGLSRQRAWELVTSGQIPAIASGRRLLVPRDALRRLADEQAAKRRAAHGGER